MITSSVLAEINRLMKSQKIAYSFVTWNADITDPYWVGEYSDLEGGDESGRTECDFILTGTTEGSWSNLEADKARIFKLFKDGYTAVLKDGTGVYIRVSSSMLVPTDTATLKRMEIHLSVITWRNN